MLIIPRILLLNCKTRIHLYNVNKIGTALSRLNSRGFPTLTNAAGKFHLKLAISLAISVNRPSMNNNLQLEVYNSCNAFTRCSLTSR